MITRLTIQNYAIIDELEIDFSGKLNVITGETGAGKSILAGALGLILGDRADAGVLVNKERKCVVEGSFAGIHADPVTAFLESHELDMTDDLVIRREIGTNNKSRAFINDTPVNLSQLQELGTLLVDLHRQFDTQSVRESDFQREVLDALVGHGRLLQEYRELFFHWQGIHRETLALREQKHLLDREADFNAYQFRELEEAAFVDNEIEELEGELRMLSQSEGIRSALENATRILDQSETPLLQQLKSMANQLAIYSGSLPVIASLVERLRSAQVELQDISRELEKTNERISYDPSRVAQLEERVSLGYRMQKKHGVQSTAGLISILDQLREKLQAVTGLDDIIREKEEESAKILAGLELRAQKISEGRRLQVKPLEEKVNKLLSRIGMPNARLKVVIETGGLQETGVDHVDFLFNANLPAGGKAASSSYQSLKKVASGGELSRLMLCIKSLVAQSMDLPTLVFDEIDSGISGEAAKQVGLIMKDLSASRQLVCITHQPQIAGRGDKHLFVYKEIEKNKVVTKIRELGGEERVQSIARMLSGESPTDAAVQNARELIQ